MAHSRFQLLPDAMESLCLKTVPFTASSVYCSPRNRRHKYQAKVDNVTWRKWTYANMKQLSARIKNPTPRFFRSATWCSQTASIRYNYYRPKTAILTKEVPDSVNVSGATFTRNCAFRSAWHCNWCYMTENSFRTVTPNSMTAGSGFEFEKKRCFFNISLCLQYHNSFT